MPAVQAKNQPVFNSPAGVIATAPGGIALNVALLATDTGPNPPAALTFGLSTGTLPAGLTLQTSGTISGTPVNTDKSYAFVAEVSNGTSTVLRTFSIVIVNTAPVWITPPYELGSPLVAGQQVSIPLMASDANGDTITYSLGSGTLPPGLTLNAKTGVLSGATTANKLPLTYSFFIVADDGHGGKSAQPFIMTSAGTGVVQSATNPVWITPADVIDVTLAQDFGGIDDCIVLLSVDGTQIGGPHDISAIYPASMVVSVSGNFGPGIHTLTVDFTNNYSGPSDPNVHVLSIVYDGLSFNNNPFQILQPGVVLTNETGLPIVQYYGGPVTYTCGNSICFPSAGTFPSGTAIKPVLFVASDPRSLPITYAVTSGSLPSGLTINPATGTMSGTPPRVAAVTNYTFTVTAYDSQGGLSPKTFTATVSKPDMCSWVSPTVGSLVGTFVSGVAAMLGTFLATSSTGNPISYSADSGSGITLTNAGSGGVIVTALITGNQPNLAFGFYLTANDGISSVRGTWLVTQYPLPVWTSSVAINQGSNIPVNAQASVTTHYPPLTYNLVSGSLPPSVTLNHSTGLISGTPAQDWPLHTFVLAATDSNGISSNSPPCTAIIQDHLSVVLVSSLAGAALGKTKPDLTARNNQFIAPGAKLVTDPFGRANSAIYFGTSTGFLGYSGNNYPLSLVNTDKFTFEFWLNKDGAGGYGNIAMSSGPEGPSWAFDYNTTGRINTLNFTVAAAFVNNHTHPAAMIGTIALPINQWVHVALTSNGITITLWINGQPSAAQQSMNCCAAIQNASFLAFPSVADLSLYGTGSQNVAFPGRDVPAVNFAIGGVRYISGVAVYTAAFNTPTQPFTASYP